MIFNVGDVLILGWSVRATEEVVIWLTAAALSTGLSDKQR